MLGGGLVRALEAGTGVGGGAGEEEEEEKGRAILCRMVCVAASSQMLLQWAPILSAQIHISTAATGGSATGGAASDHVSLESSFLVTGLRVLLEEIGSMKDMRWQDVGGGAAWPRSCAAKALEQLLGKLDLWHCLPGSSRVDSVCLIVKALECRCFDTSCRVLLLRALDSTGSMNALCR